MFELVVQQMIYDTLVNDTTVYDSVGGRIYDRVPQVTDSGDAAEYPYIVIGDDVLIQWNTDDVVGREVSAQIHIWSRYKGKQEVKTIQGHVMSALDRAEPVIVGYNVVTIDMTDSSSDVDGDGETRHGVQAYRLLIAKE